MLNINRRTQVMQARPTTLCLCVVVESKCAITLNPKRNHHRTNNNINTRNEGKSPPTTFAWPMKSISVSHLRIHRIYTRAYSRACSVIHTTTPKTPIYRTRSRTQATRIFATIDHCSCVVIQIYMNHKHVAQFQSMDRANTPKTSYTLKWVFIKNKYLQL